MVRYEVIGPTEIYCNNSQWVGLTTTGDNTTSSHNKRAEKTRNARKAVLMAIPFGADIYTINSNNQTIIGNKMYYVCRDENAILMGNKVRQCYYGHWTGDVPRCVYTTNSTNIINDTEYIGERDVIRQIQYRNHCLPIDTDRNLASFCTIITTTKIVYIRYRIYSNMLKQIGPQGLSLVFIAKVTALGYGRHDCIRSAIDLTQTVEVFHYKSDCGQPDEPLAMDIMMIGYGRYKYKCNDNTYTLYGAHTVECGPNGQWLNPFPRCVPKTYCKTSDINISTNNGLEISYTENITVNNGNRDIVYVPNGLYANLSCGQYKQNDKNSTRNEKGMYEVIGPTEIYCNNSQWVGLTDEYDNTTTKRRNATKPALNIYDDSLFVDPDLNDVYEYENYEQIYEYDTITAPVDDYKHRKRVNAKTECGKSPEEPIVSSLRLRVGIGWTDPEEHSVDSVREYTHREHLWPPPNMAGRHSPPGPVDTAAPGRDTPSPVGQVHPVVGPDRSDTHTQGGPERRGSAPHLRTSESPARVTDMCLTQNCYDMNENKCNCGAVAIPSDAHVLTSTGSKHTRYSGNTYYKHNTKVFYVCEGGTELVGNNVRHCWNGYWIGDVPRCAIKHSGVTTYGINKIQIKTSRFANETENIDNNSKLLDENRLPAPDGCKPWDTDGLRRVFGTDLEGNYGVDYIRIKVYSVALKTRRQHAIDYRFRASLNNEVQECRLSRTDQSAAADGYLGVEFECIHRKQSPNQRIYFGVGFDGESQDLYRNFQRIADDSDLSICDLNLYYFIDSCGEPDRPLVMEECKHNYTLYGHQTVKCGSNGQWLNPFPRCVPKTYCKTSDIKGPTDIYCNNSQWLGLNTIRDNITTFCEFLNKTESYHKKREEKRKNAAKQEFNIYDDSLSVDPDLNTVYEDLLIGNNVRHCRYGHWAGAVPRCAIAYNRKTYRLTKGNESQTTTTITTRPSVGYLLPEKPVDCLHWYSDGSVSSLITTLLYPATIDYIVLKVYLTISLKTIASDISFWAYLIADHYYYECRWTGTDHLLDRPDVYTTIEFDCSRDSQALLIIIIAFIVFTIQSNRKKREEKRKNLNNDNLVEKCDYIDMNTKSRHSDFFDTRNITAKPLGFQRFLYFIIIYTAPLKASQSTY
ncbi:unnamed protein product [Medioppia subpectinata]|uniref:Sushi domain-containing protein n=1 Tax=Medioppia subpectinata TaxID=1979941 RepID=A0A7R9KVC1_9ACAR|nr:unnamed protein product [Medioppia subpectinata]CAG2109352.1 unnamed protein product [Medioppia subpectinata]